MSLPNPGTPADPITRNNSSVFMRFDELQRPGTTSTNSGYHFMMPNTSYFETQGTKSNQVLQLASYNQLVDVYCSQKELSSLTVTICDKNGNIIPNIPEHQFVIKVTSAV